MTEPVRLASGKFSLYQTPKGGVHLTLMVEGETEERHVELPAMVVKMMMRRAGKDGFSAEGFAATIDVPLDTEPAGELNG